MRYNRFPSNLFCHQSYSIPPLFSHAPHTQTQGTPFFSSSSSSSSSSSLSLSVCAKLREGNFGNPQQKDRDRKQNRPNMNEKATISKELNAKHTKILEGLLKLPENRECADCRCKAPRWASVNLGVFICMQCSGIHRSLGVHISKVRSTTLDTWLPEQVAFMQSMGNEKANSYWEAEASPDLDKSGTENFIRAKYQEKKWVSKKATQPIPILGENSSRFDKLDHSEAKAGIPKKIRKFSLEEEILTKHMSQVAPITRTHGGSLDMTNRLMTSAPPRGMIPEHNTSIQNGNGTTDLFSLLYVQDSKPDPFIVPSRWATFE